MKIQIFRVVTFIIIALALSVPAAKAQQHLVLFETFTNSCDPGGAANAERLTFNANVNSLVSSHQNVIHLDHHLSNECDALVTSYSYNTANHIWPGSASPQSTQIFWGAVDRTVYSSTSTRASTTESDWTSAINTEAAQPAAATMQLVSATLDKNNTQQYILHVKVNVTLAQSIPDSLIIRYAIVQDGCVDNQNGGTNNVTLNDVVRYITYTNSSTSGNSFVVVAGGASAGTQKVMSWDQSLYGPKSFNASVPYDYTKIRLVAFLESTSGGDFKVVNAAVLCPELDTLQAPPPTLTITSIGLDSTVLTPGTNKQIFYTETNLSNGVDAYFSSDNGATWSLIGDSLPNQFNWTVPDSLTTKGKIKLVAVGVDPPLVSIEAGTFTIGLAPSVAFVRPTPGEVLHADSMYTIEWTRYLVDSVKLQYSLVNQSGGYSNWVSLGDPITDTFYRWTIPNANSFAELQLIPYNKEAPAASDTVTIERIIPNSVPSSSTASGLAITDVFPNPAASGEEMVLRYTEGQPKPVSIQVLNLLGHTIAESYHVDDQAIHLDTRSLTPGAYIVRVTDGLNVVSKRMEITR